MKKFNRIASKVIAFSMATTMTLTGNVGNFSLLSKMNVSGLTQANASVNVETEKNEKATAKKSENANKFSWDNATVYFLLTDRFLNGNKSNDNAYGRQDYANRMSDKRATFHGGDFAGITQKIEEGYFDDLGVNAIWLSAPYEQIHGYIQGGDEFFHQSYHGYYVLDYTETEKAFGTREEFKTLVDTAHSHGIRIVLDIVMNHSGYSSIGDMDEYNYGVLQGDWEKYYETADSKTAKDYNNKGKYIYYNQKECQREETEADREAWARWWGADWLRSGVAGYSEGAGDERTSPVAGLPDFKTESTQTVGIPQILQTKWKKEGTYDQKVAKYGSSGTVRSYLVKWLSEWVETYGIDGFRCDTAKHVEYESWKALKTSCVSALNTWRKNNPSAPGADWTENFWMTGEGWDHKIGSGKDGYFTSGGFDSMINFDTWGAGILSSEKVASVYEGYASAINSDKDFNQLSFMSSHDADIISRTYSTDGVKYLGSAFLLLPGAVQIYYGDETYRKLVSGIPFDGNGGAGHSLRSDMNWDSINEDVLAHWQVVGKFRNKHIAVGAGQNTALKASNGVAFARTYSDANSSDRIAAVIGASADSQVTINVGDVWSDGEAVVNFYDGSVSVVNGGSVTFNAGTNGTILLEDKGDGPLVTFKGDAEFATTETVTVGIEQADEAIISIDGGRKMKVTDGQQITIGQTAYPGDNVVISYTATGEKGSIAGKASFKKKASVVPVEKNAKIHVKMSDGSAPNLYVWQVVDKTAVNLNGAWPGKTLSTKGDDGYYVIEFDTKDSYNFIVNNTSGVKTADITGNKGELWIDVSTDSKYQIKENKSDFTKMKAAARNFLTLTSTDYDSTTWAEFVALQADAEKLIALGEDEADAKEVTAMYNQLTQKLSSLKIAVPTITAASVGTSTIKGTTIPEATVTVVYSGKTYTVTADMFTGAWEITTSTALANGTSFTVNAQFDNKTSQTQTRNVGTVTPPEDELKVSLKSSVSGTVQVGTAITLTATATGGSKEYSTYKYMKKSVATGAETTIATAQITTCSVDATEGAYTYYVVVTDSKGKTATSNAITITGDNKQIPITVAPTLTAGEGSINATWTAVTGATTYRVFTYVGGKYSVIADTKATSYTIKGLSAGTRYGVLVLANVNGKWTQFTQADLSYATPSQEASIKPVVTLTAGNERIEATWKSIAGATTYRVFTYVGGKYQVAANTTVTKCTINGLTNGTSYGVLVLAYVDGKWSSFTTADVKNATPSASVATKPVVSATAGNAKIKASWSSVAGATQYRVFTYVGGKYKVVATTTATSCEITGLTNGTSYGVLVLACVNGSWTSFSTRDIVYTTPSV